MQETELLYHADPSSEATEMTAAGISQWLQHVMHPYLYELAVDVKLCRLCQPVIPALFVQGITEYTHPQHTAEDRSKLSFKLNSKLPA